MFQRTQVDRAEQGAAVAPRRGRPLKRVSDGQSTAGGSCGSVGDARARRSGRGAAAVGCRAAADGFSGTDEFIWERPRPAGKVVESLRRIQGHWPGLRRGKRRTWPLRGVRMTRCLIWLRCAANGGWREPWLGGVRIESDKDCWTLRSMCCCTRFCDSLLAPSALVTSESFPDTAAEFEGIRSMSVEATHRIVCEPATACECRCDGGRGTPQTHSPTYRPRSTHRAALRSPPSSQSRPRS